MATARKITGPFAVASPETTGYLTEEYFVEGSTDAFDPDGRRIAGDVAYTTRFLLRRPADRSRFSGSVLLDPLHMINEMPASWTCADWIMASGHAWVGVTVHNSSFGKIYGFTGGIEAMRQQDPDRYGRLQLAEFDRPARLRSYQGPSAESFALKWNMAMAHPQGHPIMADVARLLRTDPQLCGGGVERIYACGFSQTSNFWRMFLDHGWHDRVRRDDGSGLIDAYVLIASAAPSFRPTDAILVNILSEAEVVGTIVQMQATAAPDSEVPRVRGIELPGAPHSLNEAHPGAESATDHQHTDEPYFVFLNAVLASLDTWVRTGEPMPHVPRIQRDPGSIDGLVRDEHGNAVGGVRAPWLEAPRAQYLPRCACGPTRGERVPFSEEKLRRVYLTDAAHAAAWDRAVQRLVEDRLLLPQDGAMLRDQRTRGRRTTV
jgi:hypothetical protein